MNFFKLINAILAQMDLPQIETFQEAKLPVHNKIKEYINRANKAILSSQEWGFSGEENKYVLNEFGELRNNFKYETDKSILPEPFGSELIIYSVCLELNQEPNNPKYVHWHQRYNKALSELTAAEKKYFGSPVFKIKRG